MCLVQIHPVQVRPVHPVKKGGGMKYSQGLIIINYIGLVVTIGLVLSLIVFMGMCIFS